MIGINLKNIKIIIINKNLMIIIITIIMITKKIRIKIILQIIEWIMIK